MSKLSEKEYQAQYYKNNLEKLTKYKKQHREDNREEILKQQKQSYKNNREKILKRNNKYRKDHLGWTICPDCGEGRWVDPHSKPTPIRCMSCAGKQRRGENSSCWKGGKFKDSHGYIKVWLDSTSPFIGMSMHYRNGNYVLEHRLIMAQYLGRCLTSKEKIHHRGIKYPMDSIENKQDNRIENLELCNGNGEHLALHRELKNI